MMDARDDIRDFIQVELSVGRDLAGLKDEESLLDAGIIDSLGIQKLLAFLEKHFGVKFKDDEIIPENFESVTRISNLIKAKISP